MCLITSLAHLNVASMTSNSLQYKHLAYLTTETLRWNKTKIIFPNLCSLYDFQVKSFNIPYSNASRYFHNPKNISVNIYTKTNSENFIHPAYLSDIELFDIYLLRYFQTSSCVYSVPDENVFKSHINNFLPLDQLNSSLTESWNTLKYGLELRKRDILYFEIQI